MIRRFSACSFLIFVAAVVSFARTDDTKEKAKPEAAKFEMTKDEQTLLDLLNKERVQKDLPALRPQPLLFKAARGHSTNMSKQRKMEHVLDGKTPGQRVLAAGYDYGKVSENIAESEGGKVPLAVIVKDWMESKSHRENLLSDKVTETGLGIAKNDKGEVYYTQVFARPRKIIKRRN
ncbi:MAG TPA: CAP domain-containing protein [Gemmataceae bacterium]|nr:CAP domain-containing protein [Gemmataceae bacterium]